MLALVALFAANLLAGCVIAWLAWRAVRQSQIDAARAEQAEQLLADARAELDAWRSGRLRFRYAFQDRTVLG